MKKTHDELRQYFYEEVGNWADAEDLAQMMLERLWRAERARVIHDPEAYTWTSRKNLMKDFVRRKMRAIKLMGSLGREAAIRDAVDFATNELTTMSAHEELQLARSQMKEIWWRALCLHYVDGLSTKEVSRELGVQEPTAKKYLVKARAVIHQVFRRL